MLYSWGAAYRYPRRDRALRQMDDAGDELVDRDAVNCAPHSHNSRNCLCCSSLVVWGPMVQCSGVWPWCETRVALDMLLLGLC